MDIVDVQCSRRGSHTSQEILAQERGLQRGKTAFEKRDILRGMSTSMMIIIQRTLIKSNVRYFSRYINENLYFSRLFQLVATGCGTKSQTCDVTLP